MKQKIKAFIKQNVVPIRMLVVMIIIVMTMFGVGFRITYDPDLENSWNAIIAVGTWVSAIISGIALLVAIHIPVRISEQQNKITLFDKRYSLYEVLVSCTSMIVTLKNIDDYTDFQNFLLSVFLERATGSRTYISTEYSTQKYIILNYVLHNIAHFDLLFGKIDADDNVTRLGLSLIKLVCDVKQPQDFKKYKAEFISVSDKIEKNLLPKMRTMMELSNI